MVHWPAEKDRRDRLTRAGVPKLLVVAAHAQAPVDIRVDEDWVRVPVSEQEVVARLHDLEQRLDGTTRLDGRVLRTHLGEVTLTDREARVMRVLLEHHGRVAPRERLRSASGPGAGTDRRLHDLVYRLRARIGPLGLDVFSARGTGCRLGARIDATPET